MSVAGIIWIIAAVVFGIIEAATTALVTVWFAAGAVAAAIAAQCGLGAVWQALIFVIVSGVLLCLTRPLVKKLMKGTPQNTNADRYIGMEGVVVKPIDPIENLGQIKVSGAVWSAVSAAGDQIGCGDKVRVIGIEGVRLVVEKLN